MKRKKRSVILLIEKQSTIGQLTPENDKCLRYNAQWPGPGTLQIIIFVLCWSTATDL